MSPIVEIEGLKRFYSTPAGRVEVLKGINLSIERGETLILKGVSGSGKTTLLSIIAGLDRPSEGKVLVEGEAIAKLPDNHLSHFRGRHIGMVFQHYNLIEHFSVKDNVSVPLVPMNLRYQKVGQMVEDAMKKANISHKSDMLAARLSGGEKQRCAIARAIVTNPEIVICDEPTANLDRENAIKFLDILKNLHNMGKTIIIATHDSIFESLNFSHTVVYMSDGEIEKSESIE